MAQQQPQQLHLQQNHQQPPPPKTLSLRSRVTEAMKLNKKSPKPVTLSSREDIHSGDDDDDDSESEYMYNPSAAHLPDSPPSHRKTKLPQTPGVRRANRSISRTSGGSNSNHDFDDDNDFVNEDNNNDYETRMNKSRRANPKIYGLLNEHESKAYHDSRHDTYSNYEAIYSDPMSAERIQATRNIIKNPNESLGNRLQALEEYFESLNLNPYETFDTTLTQNTGSLLQHNFAVRDSDPFNFFTYYNDLTPIMYELEPFLKPLGIKSKDEAIRFLPDKWLVTLGDLDHEQLYLRTNGRVTAGTEFLREHGIQYLMTFSGVTQKKNEFITNLFSMCIHDVQHNRIMYDRNAAYRLKHISSLQLQALDLICMWSTLSLENLKSSFDMQKHLVGTLQRLQKGIDALERTPQTHGVKVFSFGD